MTQENALGELLACPACLGPLTGQSCLACRLDFPDVDGIPWLFPDPRGALAEWRGRAHYLLAHLEEAASRHRAAAEGRKGATARRLGRMAEACADQIRRLRELLAPLGLSARREATAVHAALGTELPMHQGLSTYEANLFRDWCWGAEENDASLNAVRDVLPSGARPARLLVLGAGACRLAADLALALRPDVAVALDFNPLFLLAARRLLRGDTLELYEFPLAPRSLEDHAPLRKLAAPRQVEALALVLGDATAPPFRDGAFDLVVTPWFLDVVGETAATTIARINRLLAPGGLWLNHGSLVFSGQPPEESLSLEELLERLPAAGFSVPAPRESEASYLASPASRHARRETSVSFCAVKERDVEWPAPGRALPDWLRRSDLPVPQLPELRARALATRVHAFLLAMVDGRRTIAEMAKLMEEQQLMPAADAEPEIRRFLRRAWEELGRRGTP